GCGRASLNLAERGCAVRGIGGERARRGRARQRRAAARELADRVQFHPGDALTLALDLRAKVTIIPYNTLMHFHTQDAQLRLLGRIRQWTAQDGALVIDLPNAGEAYAGMDTGAVTLERTFLDPETGHLIMQQSVSELGRAEQLMRVTWIYDEVTGDGTVKRTVAPVVNRYFFLPEMQLLLRASGFHSVDAYGDFDYSPYADGSPRMILIAR